LVGQHRGDVGLVSAGAVEEELEVTPIDYD
jgi:hypothetical protein